MWSITFELMLAFLFIFYGCRIIDKVHEAKFPILMFTFGLYLILFANAMILYLVVFMR